MENIRGYFVLGGGTPIPLPSFHKSYCGNLVGARDKGQWVIDTTLVPSQLNIPARDKTVQVWSSSIDSSFERFLEYIDSTPGTNYTQKLLGAETSPPFVGVVVNTNVSTHGSLGLRFHGVPMFVYGLFDTQLKTAYLVWSTQDNINIVLNAMPLRFLLYRFPILTDGAVFIQGEAVCSKWWRWMRTSQQTLHAFNALEMKLYGSQQKS